MKIPGCMYRFFESVSADLQVMPPDPVCLARSAYFPKDAAWAQEALDWMDKFFSIDRTDGEIHDLYFSGPTEVYLETTANCRVFFAEARAEIRRRLEESRAEGGPSAP